MNRPEPATCPICDEPLNNPKDVITNIHIGKCHLSCALLDAMEHMPPRFRKRYAETKINKKFYRKMSAPFPKNTAILP